MSADRIPTEDVPAGGVLLQERLTRRVLRVFFDVYNELRGGFPESVYAAAFEVARVDAGLDIEREAAVPVWFRGRRVADFRADFVVESVVLVELKAVRALDEVRLAQVLNYLRATDMAVGLLPNFGREPEFRRVVLENQRKAMRADRRRSAAPLVDSAPVMEP